MTELVLVNPNGRIPAPFAAIEPPLWLGLIAGTLKEQGWKEIAIVDAEAEGLTLKQTVNRIQSYNGAMRLMVCMGNNPSVSSTPKWPITEAIINEIGGFVTGLHPLAMPYTRNIQTTFSGTPSVPWDMFDLTKYRAHSWHCLEDVDKRSPYAVLYTSLNCPYKCRYCNIHTLYGDHKVRYRPLEDVYKELDYFAKHGIRNIKIWDECFTLIPDRVIKICDYIIDHQYDFNMWAYGRLDQADTIMLSKMWIAGIRWIAYGFESMNDRKCRKIEMPLQITKECGLNIIANFMFGLPGETATDWRQSLDFAFQQNFEWVNFQVALPYPGSPWWDSIKDKGNYSDWARFSQFHPNMYGDPGAITFWREYAFRAYFTNHYYLDMVSSKFGDKAVEHIKDMLSWKIG